MKMRILSRVGFCRNCYEKRWPKDGSFFFVHGSTTDTVWRMRYDAPLHRCDCLPAGFTPHFYEVDKLLPTGQLQVRVSCGMQGCDTLYRMNDTTHQMEYHTACEHYILLSTKEWEALEAFVDTGYRL